MRRVILLLALLFVIASFFVLGLALRMPPARLSALAEPKADLATSPAVADTLERLREQQDASLTQIADLRSTISRLQGDLQRVSPATAGGPQSILVLGGGVFEHAGIVPARAAEGAIDKVMGVIHSRPDDVILVEGHSDSSATTSQNHIKKFSAVVFEANQRISLLRAQAVARMLEKKGISADRIVIRGYGDTRPLASNATEKGRSRNRRAEIKLIPSLQKR